jgi:hypothetical protein
MSGSPNKQLKVDAQFGKKLKGNLTEIVAAKGPDRLTQRGLNSILPKCRVVAPQVFVLKDAGRGNFDTRHGNDKVPCLGHKPAQSLANARYKCRPRAKKEGDISA